MERKKKEEEKKKKQKKEKRKKRLNSLKFRTIIRRFQVTSWQ